MKLWSCTRHTWTTQLLCSVIRCYKGVSLVKKYTPMEVIFNSDLLVMKIKITYLILSPLVICYFRLILIFDLDHFLGDLPNICIGPHSWNPLKYSPLDILKSLQVLKSQITLTEIFHIIFKVFKALNTRARAWVRTLLTEEITEKPGY